MRKVVISGASGFIGSRLVGHFKHHGWQVQPISWRTKGDYELKKFQIANSDVVINLAGAPVTTYWTKARKQLIWNSRIDSTNELVSILSQFNASQRPKVLFNASGCSIYGSHPSKLFTETSPHSDLFLATLGIAWEAAGDLAKQASIRVVHIRFPTVIGSDSSLWRLLSLTYKFGLGAVLGKGDNWMAWVAVDDIVKMVSFMIDKTELSGPVNVVAPNLITQKEFADAFRKIMNRPVIIPRIPKFFTKLGGQMVQELMLGSRKVVPDKLQKANYEWIYPTLPKALEAAKQGNDRVHKTT